MINQTALVSVTGELYNMIAQRPKKVAPYGQSVDGCWDSRLYWTILQMLGCLYLPYRPALSLKHLVGQLIAALDIPVFPTARLVEV